MEQSGLYFISELYCSMIKLFVTLFDGGSVSSRLFRNQSLFAKFISNCSSKSCPKLVYDLAISVSCYVQQRSIWYKSAMCLAHQTGFVRISCQTSAYPCFCQLFPPIVHPKAPCLVKPHFSQTKIYSILPDDDSNRVGVLS